MSTGADCYFREVTPGQWKYALETYPENYTAYGPFSSYQKAVDHLSSNHANPGGWGLDIHDDHQHEFQPDEDRPTMEFCEPCGEERNADHS